MYRKRAKYSTCLVVVGSHLEDLEGRIDKDTNKTSSHKRCSTSDSCRLFRSIVVPSLLNPCSLRVSFTPPSLIHSFIHPFSLFSSLTNTHIWAAFFPVSDFISLLCVGVWVCASDRRRDSLCRGCLVLGLVSSPRGVRPDRRRAAEIPRSYCLLTTLFYEAFPSPPPAHL